MKRKIALLVSFAMVMVLALSVPVSAITTKTTPDPYFGKYDKPVTVKIAVPSNAAATFPKGESYGNNVWTRTLKSDMNIDVKVAWEATDATDAYRMKMNLAIVSNNLPDIMYLSDYAQFDKLVNSGKIADLKPYYDKNAYPFLKKCLEEAGGLALQWGKVNGKMYGLSGELPAYNSPRMVYIRHDWFVKSGLPKPKTMDDVLKIAKALKDQDPKNRYGLPLFKKLLSDGMCDVIGIANAYGAFPLQWIDNGKGKLLYGTLQPEMKKAVQTYADLYKGGYIDPAFASLDGTMVGEQLTSGKIGVVIGKFFLPSWPLNSLWDSAGVDWDIYPLTNFVSNPSKQVKVQMDAPLGRMLVVRKGFANPEVLFKILNLKTAKLSDPQRVDTLKFHSDPKKPEYAYFSYCPVTPLYGPQMTNFNTQPNVTNAIEKKDKSYLKTPHDQTQYENISIYFNDTKAGKRPAGNIWGVYKFFYGADSTFGVMNKYFKDNSYLMTKLVGYSSPEMNRSWNNLRNLEDQYVTEMISGTRPVSDFDKMVKEWRNAGGEIVEYEVNDWYKSILNKK